jgi:hypothetical protein
MNQSSEEESSEDLVIPSDEEMDLNLKKTKHLKFPPRKNSKLIPTK